MEAGVKAYQSVTQREIRDRLILENLHCVRHVLGRIASGLPSFVDTDNLESAGMVGLVEAAANFDASRGVAFSTFASYRIRGAIYDELRRNCPLPQHVLEQWANLKNAWDRLGERANSATVAQVCGLTEEEVEDCLTAIRFARPEMWQENLSSHQRIGSVEEELLEKLSEEDERHILADAIQLLPRQMRTVLSLYYLEDLRMAEIGEVLDLSESRISRLITQAQLKLKSIIEQQLVTKKRK